MTDEESSRTSRQDALLPESLVWDGEHASELALTALADLQMDILPAGILSHVDMCSRCSAIVGHAALLASTMESVWQHAPKDATHPKPVKATHPVPWRALFGAGFLSIAGILPVIAELPKLLGGLSRTATHSVPVVAHVAVATSALPALHGAGGLILPGIASLVLIAASAVVVRALPSSGSSSSSTEPRSS